MNVQEAINRARAVLEKKWGGPPDRPWAVAFLGSYNDRQYRVELHVLTGSPAKGWVIVNHGTQKVITYDSSGRQIKAWFYQA